jgi:hypothetical protein
MPIGGPARVLIAAVALALTTSPTALAQESKRAFSQVGSLGDVGSSQSDNPGRIHVIGRLRLDTADYFRGAFDDVPERLDEVVFGPDLSLTFELLPREIGVLRDLTLTVGSQNGLADQVQSTQSENEWWYESNNFAGLAARLDEDWLLGLTYTIYTSPNDVSPTFQEVALAGRYTGRLFGLALGPQLKVVVPVDREDAAFKTGFYTELSLAPSLSPFGSVMTLSFPLTVGVGLDDYYGPGSGASAFGAAGVTASFPLRFMPPGYGSWTFSVGGEAVLRDDDIRRLSRFDGDDSVIFIGHAAITVTY